MFNWIFQIWKNLREWLHSILPYLVILGLLILFVFVFEWNRMVVVIHSGSVGVEYEMFTGGTITDYIYPEGIHFLWPWNTMYVYNTQVQEIQRQLNVLTKDGLDVRVDVSIRYHPEPTMVGLLQEQVGLNYAYKIAVPEVESAVRTSIGELNVEQLYEGVLEASAPATAGTGNENPEPMSVVPGLTGIPETADSSLAAAFEVASNQAARRYIVIDKVLVTRITLPASVEAAIEQKVQAEENAEAAVFNVRLSHEQIKIAKNRSKSNDLIRKSLDANLLRLKQIQAIEDLAKSPNSKMVVIGSGRNSLPLILGPGK